MKDRVKRYFHAVCFFQIFFAVICVHAVRKPALMAHFALFTFDHAAQ